MGLDPVDVSNMVVDNVDGFLSSDIPDSDGGIPRARDKEPWDFKIPSESSCILSMALEDADFIVLNIPHSH